MRAHQLLIILSNVCGREFTVKYFTCICANIIALDFRGLNVLISFLQHAKMKNRAYIGYVCLESSDGNLRNFSIGLLQINSNYIEAVLSLLERKLFEILKIILFLTSRHLILVRSRYSRLWLLSLALNYWKSEEFYKTKNLTIKLNFLFELNEIWFSQRLKVGLPLFYPGKQRLRICLIFNK